LLKNDSAIKPDEISGDIIWNQKSRGVTLAFWLSLVQNDVIRFLRADDIVLHRSEE